MPITFRIEDAQIVESVVVLGLLGAVVFTDGTAGDQLVQRFVPIDTDDQLEEYLTMLSSIPSIYELRFVPKIVPTGYRG